MMLFMLCKLIKLYYNKFYDKVIFVSHISLWKILRVLICKYVTVRLTLKYLFRRISGRFMNSDIYMIKIIVYKAKGVKKYDLRGQGGGPQPEDGQI